MYMYILTHTVPCTYAHVHVHVHVHSDKSDPLSEFILPQYVC